MKLFYTQVQPCVLKQCKGAIKDEDKETEKEFGFKLRFKMGYYVPLSNLFVWSIANREHSNSGKFKIDVRAYLTLLGEVV